MIINAILLYILIKAPSSWKKVYEKADTKMMLSNRVEENNICFILL